MSELNDNDLHKIFRAAGHSAPGTDLTARIMTRVALTRIARPLAEKPLIGKRGWVLAGGGVVVLLLVAMLTAGSGSTTPAWLEPTTTFLQRFHLPHDWSAWLLGATVCAVLFTAVDRLLARWSAS